MTDTSLPAPADRRIGLLALRIVSSLIGLIFIFSGLVKLNDPVGTQIKLGEYFEVFAQDLPALADVFHFVGEQALGLSLLFCAAEVVLGIALLIQWHMRATMWATLLLIAFFTFLTFYSAYFDKVTDCGCFGDFIKLKPWQSFWKDIALLIPILILFIFRNRIPDLLPIGAGNALVIVSAAVCLIAGIWAIRYLPFFDWRAYHVGADIRANMKPSAPLRFTYVMARGDERAEFEEYPDDTTWTTVDIRMVNPEALPRITDYRIWNDEGDSTEASLTGPRLMLIIRDTSQNSLAIWADIMATVRRLENTAPPIPTWALSTVGKAATERLLKQNNLAQIPVLYVDGTVAKTIMRTKLGLWLLDDGVVKGKWAARDAPDYDEVLAALHHDNIRAWARPIQSNASTDQPTPQAQADTGR